MLHSHVFCFKKGKENGLRHTSHITQPIICLPVTPSFLLPLFLLLPVAGFVLRQFCDSVLVPCSDPACAFLTLSSKGSHSWISDTFAPWTNLLMCFANSTILCWLGTSRSCNVLCQFCNSVLARYSSILHALRQFCNSVLGALSRLSIVLRYLANSAILCWRLILRKVSLILQFSVSSARQPSIRSHCSKLQGIQL